MTAPTIAPPCDPRPIAPARSAAAGLAPEPVAARRRPRRRSRRRGLVELAAVVGLIGVSLGRDRSPLVLGPVLFLLVVPFEKLFPRHKGQPVRRAGLGTDLAYLLAGPALNLASIAVGVVVGLTSLAWVPGLLLRPGVALLPPAVKPVAGLLLFDLAIYWVHRLSHEIPVLWRFHAVHHSTRYLDWVSGLRLHPFDGALLAPPVVLLLAAGFDPKYSGALAVIQFVTGIFLHANVRWRWRPIQRLVNTPELHHWHHSDDPVAVNRNYCGFLPLWDQVFGTWYVPAGRRPEGYGIAEPMPDGIVAQLRYPFRGLRGLLRRLWRDVPVVRRRYRPAAAGVGARAA